MALKAGCAGHVQVDEIQMLGDSLRGAAWTRALLGLPAQQLHLCGNPAALPLIQRIVQETGGCPLIAFTHVSELFNRGVLSSRTQVLCPSCKWYGVV